MARCPRCMTYVAIPTRTSPIPVRKPAFDRKEAKLAGIYECPACKAKFRAPAETETGTGKTANIKNMVERIEGIKVGLMHTLKVLHERIKTLETERSNLLIEIDKLKRVAESRASALESEVNILREEVKTLKELLGYAEEHGNTISFG